MTATAASGGEAAAVRSAKFDNLQLPEEVYGGDTVNAAGVRHPLSIYDGSITSREYCCKNYQNNKL